MAKLDRPGDDETNKVEGEGAPAAQQSSPATGGRLSEGTFAPDYEGKGDTFLGEGAHVVSGPEHAGPIVDDDMRDSPAMNGDTGALPRGSGGELGGGRSGRNRRDEPATQ